MSHSPNETMCPHATVKHLDLEWESVVDILFKKNSWKYSTHQPASKSYTAEVLLRSSAVCFSIEAINSGY